MEDPAVAGAEVWHDRFFPSTELCWGGLSDRIRQWEAVTFLLLPPSPSSPPHRATQPPHPHPP